MAYSKKTWLARLGQGLNKFILNGGSRVTLESSPDLVTQEGTPLSADNMNDLESRIDSEFTNVNDAITSLSGRLIIKAGVASASVSQATWVDDIFGLPEQSSVERVTLLFDNCSTGVYGFIQKASSTDSTLANKIRLRGAEPTAEPLVVNAGNRYVICGVFPQ